MKVSEVVWKWIGAVCKWLDAATQLCRRPNFDTLCGLFDWGGVHQIGYCWRAVWMPSSS